ncbi:MAG: hypothetical protein RR552_04735 [Oscillospiraceae bacterium]
MVGTRKLDFKSDNGIQIKGTKIFVVYKSGNDFDDGEISDSVFIKDGSKVQVPSFTYGNEYDFVYETHGLGGRSLLVKILNKDGSVPKSSSNLT